MSNLFKRTSGATGNVQFVFCGNPFSFLRETKRGSPAWGVPVLHARSIAQLALQSIALFLIGMIAMMAMVKPAQASGTVPVMWNLGCNASGNNGPSYQAYTNASIEACFAAGEAFLKGRPNISDVSCQKRDDIHNENIYKFEYNCKYTYTDHSCPDPGCEYQYYLSVAYAAHYKSCPPNSYSPNGSVSLATTCSCHLGYKPDSAGTSCVLPNSCPANMSGSPCACNIGYVPNTRGSCDPEVFTITLSGGTSTEPWHKKPDQNHEKANLTFKAVVTNQNGQAKANATVNITTDVTSDSGGHVHTNGRPKGKLVAGTPASTLGGKETLTGSTDSNGVFSFTFGAEEASGEHKLTATCSGCTGPANATVKVLIPGLMLLDADPLGYELRGSTDGHPGNHYFSAAAMVKIINLAHAYQLNPAFNKELLKINDSSLIKGGTFDVLLDWTSETNVHGGHRVGIVVDINNYHATNLLFEEFASRKHIQANWHGKGTGPHYHLLLLGRDN